MFCGTGSPIVSGASAGAFARPKSFTFSLIIKRCSWVRLIVRGWGAIAVCQLVPTRHGAMERRLLR
jgi:hypothetical protein